MEWTSEKADRLQQACDHIFKKDAGKVRDLDISLTLADPQLDGCPLIGCSTGFCRLTGYNMDEIVGRNCRFLVDPVPEELISKAVRRLARSYCEAIAAGQVYQIPEHEREPWMPQARHTDAGVFCVQKNARKDGSLFDNMFYLLAVELDDHTFILGLQTEVQYRSQEVMPEYIEACRLLDVNMAQVHRVLAGLFWYSGPMHRQEYDDPEDEEEEEASALPLDRPGGGAPGDGTMQPHVKKTRVSVMDHLRHTAERLCSPSPLSPTLRRPMDGL